MKQIEETSAKRSLKPFVAYLIIGLLIFFELVGGRSYFDEFLSLAAIAYLLYLAIKDELSRADSTSIFMLIVVIFIGLCSNTVSSIARTTFSALVDIIAETKILWIFFAAKYYFRGETASKFSSSLALISKIYISIGFICSIISQFINIGMTESERYGIHGFSFV